MSFPIITIIMPATFITNWQPQALHIKYFPLEYPLFLLSQVYFPLGVWGQIICITTINGNGNCVCKSPLHQKENGPLCFLSSVTLVGFLSASPMRFTEFPPLPSHPGTRIRNLQGKQGTSNSTLNRYQNPCWKMGELWWGGVEQSQSLRGMNVSCAMNN